jgi:hypothetical protein
MPLYDTAKGDVSYGYVDQLTGEPACFRNLLDGGDFTVNPWQRNIPGIASGGALSTPITNTPTYFPDRWFAYGGASSSIVLANVADTTVPGFSNSCLMTRSTGSNTAALYFGQVIEQLDVIKTQGQVMTLSFWARTAANYSGGALTVQLISGTGSVSNGTTVNLASGSWTGQTNLINTTQVLTSTMTRYQFITPVFVPVATTQLGVLLSWTPSGTAGTTDGIYFNGLQLELGGPASPFEHRDIQVELEICQRYAWVTAEPALGVIIAVGGAAQAANNQVYYMATPVQLRAAPSLAAPYGGIAAGSFKTCAGAAAAAATGLAAGTTHTVNAISMVTTLTQSAGGSATLQGGGGSGYIIVSADL